MLPPRHRALPPSLLRMRVLLHRLPKRKTPLLILLPAARKKVLQTPNLSVLTDSIQDLEQRIGDITPSGSAQEQKEQFLALKNEIDALDNELGYMEDTLESQYYNGSLEAAQYQEQEREIEALEDRLDNCEDQVEFIFRIDD